MNEPLIIAEASINHNGDVGRAVEMVLVAAAAGADVVKFQAFDTDTLTSKSASTAAYQQTNTGINDQAELLRSLELDRHAFRRIAQACDDVGIEFLATPFEDGMVDDLIALGMKRIKIASGELTNAPALRRLASKSLPVILSTGMADLSEIADALDRLRQGGAHDVTMLQCTSLYPAPPESMNLLTIPAMRDRFGVGVGLSDHSLGTTAAIAACALGATVIEKHFTLDRKLPGPDHPASLEPDELKHMVTGIRQLSVMLGDGEKQPTAAELETARQVRRSWHAARDLRAGDELQEEDLVLVRPANGMAPQSEIFGKRLVKPLAAGQAITPEYLAE